MWENSLTSGEDRLSGWARLAWWTGWHHPSMDFIQINPSLFSLFFPISPSLIPSFLPQFAFPSITLNDGSVSRVVPLLAVARRRRLMLSLLSASPAWFSPSRSPLSVGDSCCFSRVFSIPLDMHDVSCYSLQQDGTFLETTTGLSKRNGAKLRESFCPAAASHSQPRQAGS